MGKNKAAKASKVVVMTSREDDDEVGTIDLFTIDGVAYSIPNRPRANVAVGYLRYARQNQDAAVGYLLEESLGEEAFTALMEYEDLTNDDLAAIVQRVQQVVLGGLEAPKGS